MIENETKLSVETLACTIHQVYQEEAKRQGDVRHSDDYHTLPENVKAYDRAIARFILENFEEKR